MLRQSLFGAMETLQHNLSVCRVSAENWHVIIVFVTNQAGLMLKANSKTKKEDKVKIVWILYEATVTVSNMTCCCSEATGHNVHITNDCDRYKSTFMQFFLVRISSFYMTKI